MKRRPRSERRTALAARARRGFADAFGSVPAHVAVAPGRVNLIGEHTDYNDGFVLPMAIDRAVAVAFAPRVDEIVRAHSALFGETREISVMGDAPHPRAWHSYIAAVIAAFKSAGLSVCGADLAIVSDLPMGAGLSSSAALELATARAFCASSAIEWNPREMARLARFAENEFVGVSCGIMDQCAASLSVEGAALLLDCRSLETRLVRLPTDACVVVMDTGVRRSLTASAYNKRRAACERAVTAVRTLAPPVVALRDVDEPLLTRARDRMDDEAYRRADHVVAEIARPVAMAERLEANDLFGAGRLMHDSHASLRDLYEVSCPELDAIVSAAGAAPGCHGARLTGAGFGGCAIALVDRAEVDAFIRAVSAQYHRATGIEASLFVSAPAPGARLVG